MKFKKQIVSILMCAIFILPNTTAYANSESPQLETGEITFDIITSMVENSSEFEDVEYGENTITYIINDEIGEITLLEDSDTIEKIQFTEGDKTDILEFDKIQNKLYSNGTEIIVNERVVNNVNRSSWGDKFDEKYRDTKLDKKISGYTKSALTSILAWALGFDKNIGAFFAGAILEACIPSGYADSDAIFCYYYKRLKSDYTKYRQYWNMYWDPDYEDFCESYYQDFLNQGN